MQTIKTAVVVVLLLFVLYGGYVALNGTDTPLNPELQNLVDMDGVPDVSGPAGPFVSTNSGGNTSTGFENFNNTPAPNFSNSAPPSPFAQSFSSPSSTTSELNLPPLGLPGPPGSGTKDTGLNLPPNGSAVPSTLSSTKTSPSLSNSTALPSLPPLPTLAPLPGTTSPTTSPTPSPNSIPVSTKTPSLELSELSPKIAAELTSSSSPLSSSTNGDSFKSEGIATESISESVNVPTKSTAASKAYENAKSLALEQIGRSSLKEALATLSVFYNAQELTVEQRHDLLDLLDALAREVIFSRRHFLENVYVVAPGETLTDVSRRFNVPPDIIARINAIDTTMQLASGAKLKVVPGPFRAEVDLSRSELTIFLGDLYAGRYPVSFGNDPSPKAGLFQVIEKQQGRNYYGTGIQLPKEDPRNPYGGWWIDLGQDVCLHGSPENSADSKLGCISLSPMDASDIYGMLGRGSPVTVRK